MEQSCAVEECVEKNTSSCTTDRKRNEEESGGGSTEEAMGSPALTVKTKEEEDDNKKKLSVICWNLDGLDGEKQPQRARALCSYLSSHSPDVVLLQELIQPYLCYMKRRLEDRYKFIEGGKECYFTGMLLKKARVTLLSCKKATFQLSQMGRNLLIAQVLFREQKLCLMTSHLESCRANAPERMRQLRMVMNRMTAMPDDVTVLFGGDTNLRDAEVATVGIPSPVCDVWEQLGEPEDCRYTWDTYVNTNRDMEFKNHLRFDRLYLRRATKDGAPQLQPERMALVGLEKLECGCYISDHWGIHCTFSTQ
ncbi:tyrosyl-DNA phosphodiesterase 2-like isoform 2-T2 [Symphorus nematophorus]